MLLLAYNQQDSIVAAINAAFAQTYPNLEIVISDDASTDDTFARMQRVVDGYRGPHRVLLNRNPKNLGIGAHINRMVGLSQGELLFIAAGDDISLPRRCEQVVAAWLACDRVPDLIAGRLIDMDEHGALHDIIAPTDLSTYRNAADWLARPPHVIGAGQAWTRRLFDRFGPLPAATMGEDLLMVLRAVMSGGAISVDVPLVQYRRGGLSRRRRALHAKDVIARLLKNNRSALAELRQMLADARLADQLDAVEEALNKRLAREQFIRSLFAAKRLAARLSLVRRAVEVPFSVRLRMLVYAAFPGLLAPFFALKRWRADGRG
jgi:glycosyltransferase involved in cell wall biosynthesis